MSQTHGVFDNYNAKLLTTDQLVDSFIVNTFFHQLAGPNHTLLIGPRGSGKTTLLKMLQVESLARWNDPVADEVRLRSGFVGVFVPTDIVWATQSKDVAEKRPDDTLVPECLSWLFTLHVLECLAHTLLFRVIRSTSENATYKRVIISSETEQLLVDGLSEAWRVRPDMPSLRSLYNATISASLELSRTLGDYLLGRAKRDQLEAFATAPIAQLLSASIKLANSAFDEPQGKWCFLFDELELAPRQILDDLVVLMRSGDPNIIYKLSLVPFLENLPLANTFQSPMANHDFSTVELTRFDGREEKRFAEALCGRVFFKQGFAEPIHTYFEEPIWEGYDEQVASLMEKDESFKKYLDEHGIDGHNLPQSDGSGRTEIRKLRWPVFLRNYFFKDKTRKLRSIKSPPDVYVGFESLCQALEFNPRMLIGAMNKLVQKLRSAGRVTIVDQIETLRDTEMAFYALLNTIPVQSDRVTSLARFVDLVGEFVAAKQILGPDFLAEPKGSFTMGRNTVTWIVGAVRVGLNTGALVRIASGTRIVGSPADELERFRLSNIFAHKYRLPTTLMRTIGIEVVLGSTPGDGTIMMEFS